MEKTDPLDRLKKIAEEIPSGVSSADVSATLNMYQPSAEETVNVIHAGITKRLKEELEKFWELYQINSKIENLKTLEANQENLNLGDKINTIKSKWLLQQKEEIVKKSKEKKTEIEDIQQYLKNKTQIIGEYKQKIQSSISDT